MMNLNRIFAAMLLGTLLAGCASEKAKRAEFFAQNGTVREAPKNKKIQPPPFTRAEAEEAICELVIVRFAHDASAWRKTGAAVIFVGLTPNHLDPEPGFLRKFESRKIAILPSSAAARSEDNKWIDKSSGKRGVTLRIDGIDWRDFYHVQVAYAWSVDSSAGTEQTSILQLSWKKGRWIVL